MRIGIIGAGQLGQMLGFAARELGYSCRFLDPSEDPPARVAGEVLRAAYDDGDALAELADWSDVLTYEFENVPVAALEAVAGRSAVYPPPQALRIAQDRLLEKRLFEELGIPLAPYRAVASRQDLDLAVAALGLPLIVKTRRFGYDGKGQFLVRDAAGVADAWSGLRERPAVAEAFVDFDFEVSIIGVRNSRGDTAAWPLTRNEHQGGILRRSRAPVDDAPRFAEARDFMDRLLVRLGYVGVLALELFVAGRGLMANEFAPRVHNSGHWTIEGAVTSQFTNHLLAISGRPPGPTDCRGHAGMMNLIGEIPDAVRAIRAAGLTLHDYGKAPRPGRKLGHLTVVADTAVARDRLLAEIGETVTQRTAV